MVSLALLTSTVITLFGVVEPSVAYQLIGCKFKNGDPTMPYRFTAWVSSSRKTASQDGGKQWNATAVPGTFATWHSGDPEKITVTEGSYVDDFEAVTVGSCGSGGPWSGNHVDIYWNTPSPGGIGGDSLALMGAATHELGHAYGLNHTGITAAPCAGTPSIMRPTLAQWMGCGWGDWPFKDDKDGVRAIYN